MTYLFLLSYSQSSGWRVAHAPCDDQSSWIGANPKLRNFSSRTGPTLNFGMHTHARMRRDKHVAEQTKWAFEPRLVETTPLGFVVVVCQIA